MGKRDDQSTQQISRPGFVSKQGTPHEFVSFSFKLKPSKTGTNSKEKTPEVTIPKNVQLILDANLPPVQGTGSQGTFYDRIAQEGPSVVVPGPAFLNMGKRGLLFDKGKPKKPLPKGT